MTSFFPQCSMRYTRVTVIILLECEQRDQDYLAAGKSLQDLAG